MRGREAVLDTEAARGLGWASIGIGLAEIVAPKQVQDLLGIPDRASHRGTLRVLGAREIAHGYSLLSEDKPNRAMKRGLWSRVAGDVLDTAVLGLAATRTREPARFAAVAAAVMGIGLLDFLFAQRLERHA